MERMNHDAGTLGKNSNLYEFPMSNFARPVSKTFSSPVTPSPYIQSPDTPQTPKSPFNGTVRLRHYDFAIGKF